MAKLLGSIEAGGTKFVCAIGDYNLNIVEKVKIATSSPDVTMDKVIEFFSKYELSAIGVGSFGPIDTDNSSKTYGYITTTPKEGWSNYNFVGKLRESLSVPIYWTTDVNSSAYGEYLMQNNGSSLVYYTIGTGIGAGAIIDGKILGGARNTEMGHVILNTNPLDEEFEGVCPYHKNECFEGVASGPSIEARLGIKGEDLPREDDVFDLIAYYAGQALWNMYVTLVPEKIIIGGSVLKDLDMVNVRKYFEEFSNGYLSVPKLNNLISFTKIPDNGAATVGNFGLAKKLLIED